MHSSLNMLIYYLHKPWSIKNQAAALLNTSAVLKGVSEQRSGQYAAHLIREVFHDIS